jgi:hypothetical protein
MSRVKRHIYGPTKSFHLWQFIKSFAYLLPVRWLKHMHPLLRSTYYLSHTERHILLYSLLFLALLRSDTFLGENEFNFFIVVRRLLNITHYFVANDLFSSNHTKYCHVFGVCMT